MKVKIISLLMIMIVFNACILCGCGAGVNSVMSSNHNVVKKVTEYKTKQVEVNSYNSSKSSIFYDAVMVENINYLEVEDFIDLCNRVNKEFNYIMPLTLESFSEETLELNLEYKVDVSCISAYFSSIVDYAFAKVNASEIEGENKNVTLKLNDITLKPILVEDKLFIPIDTINYYIFEGESTLIRTREAHYELLGSGVNIGLPENYYFLEPNNRFHCEVNYKLAIACLNEYMESNVQDYKPIDIEGPIENYSDYIIAYYDILDSLNDYHVKPYSAKADADWERVKTYVNKSKSKIGSWQMNALRLNKKKESNIAWEYLNDGTLYVKINTFAIKPHEFMIQLNPFCNELRKRTKETNVVIDLRGNTGGLMPNPLILLDRLASDAYTVEFQTFHQKELLSNQSHTFKKKNPKEQLHNFTVIADEYSASASLITISLLKDNLDATVIGREPLYKQPSHLSYFQLLDGTSITRSFPNYQMLHNGETLLKEATLVDKEMSDEEIEAYISKI